MDIEKYGCKCIGISTLPAPFCPDIKCHFFRYLCLYPKTRHSLLQNLDQLSTKLSFIDSDSVFVNAVSNKLMSKEVAR